MPSYRPNKLLMKSSFLFGVCKRTYLALHSVYAMVHTIGDWTYALFHDLLPKWLLLHRSAVFGLFPFESVLTKSLSFVLRSADRFPKNPQGSHQIPVPIWHIGMHSSFLYSTIHAGKPLNTCRVLFGEVLAYHQSISGIQIYSIDHSVQPSSQLETAFR